MITPTMRILMAGAAASMLCAVPVLAQNAAAPAATPAAAAPAAAAAAPAADAEDNAPPVLPTTGDGGAVVKLLANLCKPLVEGRGDFDTLAKAAGMTLDKNSGDYVLALSQRPFQISAHKPSNQNLTLCELHIAYAPGWDQPIIDALNTWRFLHAPQLHLERNEIGTYSDAQRTTLTWDNWANQGFDGIMVGLDMVKLKKTDGSPLSPYATDALIQYSQRSPLPESVAAARQAKIDHDAAMAKYEADKKAYDEAQAAEALRQQQQAQQAQAQQPAPPPASAPAPATPAS